MSRVRVCFLGTPEFAATNLKALLADEHFEVVGVVTQPDRPSGRKLMLVPTPVKQVAQAHQLPILAPESLRKNPLMLDQIKTWRAEVAVVVAYGQILNQEFLASFPFGCVNVHASLLPRWRGAAPIQRAIEAGDTETGVALQKVVKKLDAGDVLGSRTCAISPDLNSQELHDKLAQLGSDLLAVELMDYMRGHLAGRPQDEAQVTHAKKIDKAEGLLDFHQPAQVLHNKVRAFVWGPGTHFLRSGKAVKVHRTFLPDSSVPLGLANANVKNKVGDIVAIDAKAVYVCTGKGNLALSEVQPESRNRQPAQAWARAVKLEVGSSLFAE